MDSLKIPDRAMLDRNLGGTLWLHFITIIMEPPCYNTNGIHVGKSYKCLGRCIHKQGNRLFVLSIFHDFSMTFHNKISVRFHDCGNPVNGTMCVQRVKLELAYERRGVRVHACVCM